MIEFQKLTMDSKSIIQKYTLNSRRRNCDLSFANLYSWWFFYETEYAEYEGFLLLRYKNEGELAYMMPVGKGDLRKVIEAIIEDAHSLGHPFHMFGVSPGMRADLDDAMPDVFIYTPEREYFDYIYHRTDLATLAGKKFQPKRNFVNRFVRNNPVYEYKELTPELVPECLMLEAAWYNVNDDKEKVALEAVRRSMTEALHHMTELDLIGGVLHVDGNIVAFTYGAPINEETFDVCVEKASTFIEGAYTMINCEFARHLPEQYIYMNREEDLGIEGLRKAKLSYHPYVLLEKCRVELKSEIKS